MNIANLTIKALRKVYRVYNRKRELPPDCNYDRFFSNQCILKALLSEKPCMISRIGSGEMGILVNYLAVHSEDCIWKKIKDCITAEKGLPWWDTIFFKSMRRNAGIFPEDIKTLESFSEEYMRCIPEMDIIGSFNSAEKFLPLKEDIVRVHLECLYPFFVERPWTIALANKKILVVHPFETSIRQQYLKRSLLFSSSNILPNFELLTLKAVQSNAGNIVPYCSWFDALNDMKKRIDAIEFDICLLGCGAYGLPLAAHVKRIGKKAIHMGGGLQLLFGIKGKRWDDDKYHWNNIPDFDTNYSKLYNEFWIRPCKEETPQNAASVEGGCYW